MGTRSTEALPGHLQSQYHIEYSSVIVIVNVITKFKTEQYMFTYFILFIHKTKLPGHVLENLHLLTNFCTVDYPMPDNPKRAILYRRSSTGGGGGEDENSNRTDSSVGEEELRVREELGRRLSNHAVPSLQIPKEEYPSVLVVEATNTNGVILR